MTTEQSLTAEGMIDTTKRFILAKERIEEMRCNVWHTADDAGQVQCASEAEAHALLDIALASLTRPALSEERIREIASNVAVAVDSLTLDERRIYVAAAIRQALRESSAQPVSEAIEPTEEMLDAPRQFIAYCETPGRTLQGAREHMRCCGVSIDSWPEWAKRDEGHITKSGVAAIVWAMMQAVHPPRQCAEAASEERPTFAQGIEAAVAIVRRSKWNDNGDLTLDEQTDNRALDRLAEEIRAISPAEPGMVLVPKALADALREWTGAEPSQSVLSRAVDDWLAAAGTVATTDSETVSMPEEPTEAMLHAGHETMFVDVRYSRAADIVRRGYKAMLAAYEGQ